MSALPGLPDLAADVAGLFSEVIALTSDVSGVGAPASQWGIFLNGEPVVLADNVVSLEYTQEFSISDYPVEQGAFSSYNKVQHPQELRLRFSTGGSVAARTAFLDSVKAIIGDTNLYDVVTPEETYTSLNLTRQNYRRTASEGLGLVILDVSCREVRSANLTTSNTATAATGNTGTGAAAAGSSTTFDDRYSAIGTPQAPAASPQVNGGNVQPLTPTASQEAAFTDARGTGFDF